ncbi:5'/3'-nucleotidase SurE [Gilliamella mensalis]|uniref:5'/3'-nucleotidase SurE n=1 Tax=Gilliamella mensalis TaxID=1908520 RepID=UPI001428B8F5|nr:5'/3'-nucleotidase SurE [Gilliamella mensalis]
MLSEINNSSNVGFETILSGTVDATMMAMTLEIPAIALSQVTNEDNQPTNWDCVKHHAQSIITKLLSLSTPQNICCNVKFPACSAHQVKGLKITKQGDSDVSRFVVMPTQDPQGNDYLWFRAKRNLQILDDNKEFDAVNANFIAITPLGYERTNYTFYKNLL